MSFYPTVEVITTENQVLTALAHRIQPGDIVVAHRVNLNDDNWLANKIDQSLLVVDVEWKDLHKNWVSKITLSHKGNEHTFIGEDASNYTLYLYLADDVYCFQQAINQQKLRHADLKLKKLQTERDILLLALQGQREKK
jgi:hypothetical protein